MRYYTITLHNLYTAVHKGSGQAPTHRNLKIKHFTLLYKWAAIAQSVQRLNTDLTVQGSNASGGGNFTRPSLGTTLPSVQLVSGFLSGG